MARQKKRIETDNLIRVTVDIRPGSATPAQIRQFRAAWQRLIAKAGSEGESQ